MSAEEGTPFTIQVDAEAVTRQVVDAILASAIGEHIATGVDKALKKDSFGRQSVVEQAIASEIQQQTRTLMREMLREPEFADAIRTKLREALTPEQMDNLVARFVTDLGLVHESDLR